MNKFEIIKIMNEATLRLKKSKNENCETNEMIKKFLQDETIFFKLDKETALNMLINVGVNKEKLNETYENLISRNVYNEFVKLGKIDPTDTKLIIKYEH